MSVDERDARFKEIRDKYMARFPSMIQELEELLEARDFVSIGEIAHRLKGTAIPYGFPEIGEEAATLNRMLAEDTASVGEWDEATQKLLTVLRQAAID